MKIDNPFDRMLETGKRMPEPVRAVAVELTAALDLCWAAAQAVFEDRAAPEHALALLPLLMARTDAERRHALAEDVERMVDA